MDALLLTAAKLAAVFFLTLVSGFFVAAEYALVTLRKTRIEELAGQGNRAARAVKRTLDDLSTLLAATQLGVTLISLLLGALAEPTVARLLQPLVNLLPPRVGASVLELLSVSLAFIAITALDIIVGELAPKAIGLRYNERVALVSIGPIRAFMWLFRPFITVLEIGGSAIAGLAGAGQVSTSQTPHSPEELKRLVMASRSAGILEPDEEEMLIRVFEFSRMAVRQIMVPRTEMAAVPVDITFRQLLALSARERHTRLPVYKDTLDDIVGIVHVRDFLHRRDQFEGGGFDIRTIMRTPLSVPETMRIDDLFRGMQQQRVQIAIAIDEFGGTAGLVTVADVLERIVGEVQDEFEPAVSEIEMLPDGGARVDGLTLIDDVNTRFGLHLDDANYDTIGGYVFGELGRRAEIGDEVSAEGRTLRVIDLDGLRIALLELSAAPSDSDGVPA
jgi:CBS domain containing-hemolysin-like protein